MKDNDYILSSIGQENSESSKLKCSSCNLKNPKRIDFLKWNFWISIVGTVLMLFILISISGIIPFLLRNEKSGQKAISAQESAIENFGHHEFMPLSALNFIPLEMVEKVESLTLQWGATGSGKEVKYYFQVEFAMQDKAASKTTIGLSFGHKLILTDDGATLYDPQGESIGVIQFDESDDEMPGVQRVIEDDTIVIDESSDISRNFPPRKLAKKENYGRYPYNVDQGLPQSFFDAYCRYGCGGMSVTFPYYYRPFFGYGYPLVGTEAMFPQGYGGYPAAEILASQAGSVPLSGISSPRPGGNGANGANGAVSGGGNNFQVPM